MPVAAFPMTAVGNRPRSASATGHMTRCLRVVVSQIARGPRSPRATVRCMMPAAVVAMCHAKRPGSWSGSLARIGAGGGYWMAIH